MCSDIQIEIKGRLSYVKDSMATPSCFLAKQPTDQQLAVPTSQSTDESIRAIFYERFEARNENCNQQSSPLPKPHALSFHHASMLELAKRTSSIPSDPRLPSPNVPFIISKDVSSQIGVTMFFFWLVQTFLS